MGCEYNNNNNKNIECMHEIIKEFKTAIVID